MAQKTAKSLHDLRLEVFRLYSKYQTALYAETMPEYDPVYKYCFQSSNLAISPEDQSVRAWLQAIADHMATRAGGHGGCQNTTLVVEIPSLNSDKAIEQWVNFISTDLRKLAVKRKKRKKSV